MNARAWLPRLGIAAAYLGIAVIITLPLVVHLGERFAGFPYGDAYENARHMWWMTHALRSGEPLFFQPLLGYPNGIAGLTLHATPLLLFPGWLFAFILPLPAAYNLHLLLTLALNGCAMHAFAHALTRRQDAAFIAGVVFMSYPTLQGHLGASHLNILAQWGLPLYAWALWRLSEPANRAHGSLPVLLWAAVAFVATAWAHTIQIIYTLLPITTLFLVSAAVRRDARAFRRILAGAGMGAGLILLWLLPLFSAAFSSAYVSDGGSVRFSADLLAPVSPSFFHPLWGLLNYPRAVLGTNLDEGSGYIGLVAGMLALVGIWRVKAARPWLWLALAALVLSLGPLLRVMGQPVSFISDDTLGTVALPWALLERLPGFALARTPGRFNLTTAFAVAVMAAYGAAWLFPQIRRASLRPALALGCAALILFDYQTFFPLPTTRADIPAAFTQLRERGDVRAVFDIPWANLLAAKDALYLQTAHQQPLVAGHVTRRTPVDPAKLTLLEATLDPALLDEAGADVIILHLSYVSDAERTRVIAALGAPFYQDERFALFARPQPAAPPTPQAIIADADSAAYLYTPQAGWALLDLALTGGQGGIMLMQDDSRLWSGAGAGRVPLLLSPGYTTARWLFDLPCPASLPPGLRCDQPLVEASVSGFADVTNSASAVFEGGIRLNASRLVRAGETLEAWLVWSFETAPAPNDIRYLHLLADDGSLIAQVDGAPGVPSAGGWNEIVTLSLPDALPAGNYRVVVGWYRLPDVMPIARLDGGDNAGTIEIGNMALP